MSHTASNSFIIDPALLAIYGRPRASAPNSAMASSSQMSTPLGDMSLLDPALLELTPEVKRKPVIPPKRSAIGLTSRGQDHPSTPTSNGTEQSAVQPVAEQESAEVQVGGSSGSMPEIADPGMDRMEKSASDREAELDPSIQEIVQSLKNAQRNQAQEDALIQHDPLPIELSAAYDDASPPEGSHVPSALAQALDDAETAATISAHLMEADGIDHELRTSLSDLTAEQLDSIFQTQNDQSDLFLPADFHSTDLTDLTDEAGPSSTHSTYLDYGVTPAQQPLSTIHDTSSAGPSTSTPAQPAAIGKRGRGRPKGAKNRPKPAILQSDFSAQIATTSPIPSKPKKVGRPPKERKPPGRPRKERSGSELEEYLKRREEAAMGIKRQRGRPRKFPGYLIREMRLRENREEFREVVRRFNEDRSWVGEGDKGIQDNEGMVQEEVDMGVGEGGRGGAEEDRILDDYDWANDPQSLMEAVTNHEWGIMA